MLLMLCGGKDTIARVSQSGAVATQNENYSVRALMADYVAELTVGMRL